MQRFRAPGKTYNEATAIATDANGNVFVTGYSYNTPRTSDQWTTVAYSGAGTPLWTNYYFGSAGINDYATAMAVDEAGNVFVTGYSASTNVAPYGYDYVTIKYSFGGVPLWTNRYNGPADSLDYANAVAVDGVGDVFVTGYSANTGSYPYSYDFATIKYSNAGLPLWTNRLSSLGSGNDAARALALNHKGNVFVTGSSLRLESSTDYLTVSYSSSGLPLWTNRYCGSGNGPDFAQAIASDVNGNVLVTGYSANANAYPLDHGYVTIKYSETGVPLWTNRYDGPAGSSDYAYAVALDTNGDVYVTGASVGSHYDFATVKYSSAGVSQWTNRWNGAGNSDDSPTAAAVDDCGNVFVTGRSYASVDGYNYATVSYSHAGAPLWTELYNGPGNSADEASAIVVDSSGNLFVTGTSSASGGSSEYATIKYALGIRLGIQKMGSQIVLTWANAGFSLQSASTITGDFTNLPGATSPFTNTITGRQQFFRLISD